MSMWYKKNKTAYKCWTCGSETTQERHKEKPFDCETCEKIRIQHPDLYQWILGVARRAEHEHEDKYHNTY